MRLSVADARARLRAAAPPLAAVERVAVEVALGRLTAEPISARASVPHFHACAMDGIAVRARDTAAAAADRPLDLRCDGAAGAPRFAWVDTGNPLPQWADAVIMVEALHRPDGDADPTAGPRGGVARIRAPAAPWQHVRVVGEDVVAGERLLPAGRRLRPQDVGLLLAAGVTEVAVRPRPRVAIVPTGDELIEPDAERVAGKIVETNSRMVAAWVAEWGGDPLRLPPVGDDPQRLTERLRDAAARADVVCVIAGSSAGSRDYTAQVLAALGTVLAHGIDLVPGRPTILAALDAPASVVPVLDAPPAGAIPAAARVAIGIPGYPVAAAMVCRELVEPLLAHLVGCAASEARVVVARAAQPLSGRRDAEEIVRVDVGPVAGGLVARPLARGAGALATLSRASGLVRLQPGAPDVARWGEIAVELLEVERLLQATLLASGCVDPALGAIEDAARAAAFPLRIAVRAVPLAAALRDLRAGAASAAVVAGPPASREALERSLRHALGDALRARVLRVASRDRGLVVAAGNPLRLSSAEAVRAAGARAVPALRRAGVRALAPPLPVATTPGSGDPLTGAALDAPPSPIGEAAPADADAEELPPLALAAAVAGGLADVASGTAWSASRLGLAFVPVACEEVRLVVREDAPRALLRAIVAALASPAFRAAAGALIGYDAARSGETVASL